MHHSASMSYTAKPHYRIFWILWKCYIALRFNFIINQSTQHNPNSKVHGASMGPTGLRWAPCWPHEPCYLGRHIWLIAAAWQLHVSVNSAFTGSGNGLSPVQHQAFIWINGGLLSIRTYGTHFIENSKDFIQENVVCNMAVLLSWPHCFNMKSYTICVWIDTDEG